MRMVCVTSMQPGSQGEWTGMHTRERWWLHCTSQWGWKMLLSKWACVLCGHPFKMTKWGQQRICIKFCIKLEHSSLETIQMIQKAAFMGNWWLAASSRQQTRSHITSHAEFFAKTSNHPSDSDLVPCYFWLFSKLKSPLKGKRFQTIDEI